MLKILSQIISAILGLWLATLLGFGVVIKNYPDSNFFGIALNSQWKVILFLGVILGLVAYFAKIFAEGIDLPLRRITFEIVCIVISGALIMFLDLVFDELYLPWFMPVLYTALVLWATNIVTDKILIDN
jgi:uncharacterized membrane protein YvlD (DUF360 family)